MTQTTRLLMQFYIFCLLHLRIVVRAKFHVSSFARYGDMEGSQNLKKLGHVIQATPFCGNCTYFLEVFAELCHVGPYP